MNQVGATSFGAELLAAGFDLDGLPDRAVAESTGHAVVEKFEVGVLEFNDLAAVDADEMVVARSIVEIRVVGRLVAAEVDLVEQVGLDEQRDRPIDGCPGGIDVLLADPVEEFLGGEVLVGREGKPDNGIALGRATQALLADEGVELFEDRVVHGRKLAGLGAGGKLFPDRISCRNAFRIGKIGGDA